MTAFMVVDDLLAFAPDIDLVKAQGMVEDASALAVLAAPCLGVEQTTLTAASQGALKAILRGAILRWNDAGTGALAGQTAGPFGQTIDTRQPRRGMFWPSEIQQLRDICAGVASGDAFSIDTLPSTYSLVHADICALNFGATYCSCGAVLTGDVPLFGIA